MTRILKLGNGTKVIPIRPHQALNQTEEEKYKCTTCDAPRQEDSEYCLHCEMYWKDVDNGLFDDPWEPIYD